MKRFFLLFLSILILFSVISCENNVYLDAIEHIHTLVYYEAKNPSCTESGNIAYWKCSSCGKYYTDTDSTTELNWQTDIYKASLGHHFATEWSKDNNYHWHVCLREGCEVTDTKAKHSMGAAEFNTLDNKWHSFCTVCNYEIISSKKMTHHPEVPATCTSEGMKEYWSCDDDGKDYSDAYGEIEVTDLNVLIIGKLNHQMTETAAKDATCTKDGNNEYYYCSSCEKYYKDSAGNTETTIQAEVIQKLGHNVPQNPSKNDYKFDDDNHWLECERCSERISSDPHDFQIVFNADTASRSITINSYCTVCGKEYTHTKPSQTGTFDISVADNIEVQRTAPYANSWVISVKDEIANQYKDKGYSCKWYGNNQLITGLEGTDSFTVSCGVTEEDTYLIYCQITDSNENLMEVCTVQISK